ncbi:MAG: hypothetical protein ABR955_14335 [Verrucomicrobiota bacterium]
MSSTTWQFKVGINPSVPKPLLNLGDVRGLESDVSLLLHRVANHFLAEQSQLRRLMRQQEKGGQSQKQHDGCGSSQFHGLKPPRHGANNFPQREEIRFQITRNLNRRLQFGLNLRIKCLLFGEPFL